MHLETDDLGSGVYAAALTPMRADFSPDYQKLASHVRSLLERGCKGVALFGTTGEGPSFSSLERIDLLQKLIEEGIDPKKILVANGSSNIRDTAQLGKEALKHGCAAFLVVPPSFYKNISDEGVLAFYREVIEKIARPNLRLILYHIPQYSGVPISLEVIAQLRKEFPKIVIGIKESAGDLSFTKAILKKFPGFKVFVGKEKQIIETVHLGGAGAICGLANVYPEQICSLYDQGKRANSPNPLAIDMLFNALQGIPFIAAAKAIMENREGKIWQTLRPPLMLLTAAQKKRLIAALYEAGLEEKASV